MGASGLLYPDGHGYREGWTRLLLARRDSGREMGRVILLLAWTKTGNGGSLGTLDQSRVQA